MMKLRYLGHSAFELKGGGAVILTDPFLSGGPESRLSAESFEEVDFIFVTHGHSDHIGDTEKIRGLCKGWATGHVREIHRPGEHRRAGAASEFCAGHSPHELHDA